MGGPRCLSFETHTSVVPFIYLFLMTVKFIRSCFSPYFHSLLLKSLCCPSAPPPLTHLHVFARLLVRSPSVEDDTTVGTVPKRRDSGEAFGDSVLPQQFSNAQINLTASPSRVHNPPLSVHIFCFINDFEFKCNQLAHSLYCVSS